MPTLVIVGAGPGLGLAIARIFGRNGFQVALVARTQAKLDELAAQLGEEGVEAAGFAADLMDRPTVVDAFARIKERFGAVDVLEYSPAPHTPVPGVEIADALSVTPENVQGQIEFYVYGAITAVQQVLADMLQAGRGTLMFTTGGSSYSPRPPMGNVGIGTAALRNWALSLHEAVKEQGVYVAHVPINVWIGQQGPASEPDAIAQVYWELYSKRDEPEHRYPGDQSIR
jgi:NAD(P)-dependent dehydrogenase (short-subunit alcohol dehydrogenase family)